ncbi:hypothetical protein FOZ62_023348 [Perkinsus olseni]|uniref:Uncharacterized protein n=1 Tax=Perkinsus olseni TaxID=32597 RepID=A0A7J6RQY1_PEROL|nr:hypothetical protein FOZ62_023348 [Perkinsus olseni]
MLSLVPKPKSDIPELASKISARVAKKSGPPVVVRSVGDFVALHNTDVFKGLNVGFSLLGVLTVDFVQFLSVRPRET